MDQQSYFQHVVDESSACFDLGLSSWQAAERIVVGAYRGWREPAHLVISVERAAYREFRDEPTDAPWDLPKILDGMDHLAKVKGLPQEF